MISLLGGGGGGSTCDSRSFFFPPPSPHRIIKASFGRVMIFGREECERKGKKGDENQ